MEGQINGLCGSISANTGHVDCWAFDKTPKGIIITTEDYFIDLEMIIPPNTLEDAIREAVYVSSNCKVFPIVEGLVNLEPSGGEVRTAQEGFGSAVVNGNNPYQEIYTYNKGGICALKELSKFDGQNVRVMWVDESDTVYGIIEGNYFKGIPVSFGSEYRRNTGTVMPANRITLLYDSAYKQYLQKMHSFGLTSELLGIRGFEFIQVGDLTFEGDETIVDVKAVMTCSGKDITEFLYRGGLTTQDISSTGTDGGILQAASLEISQVNGETVLAISYFADPKTIAVKPAIQQTVVFLYDSRLRFANTLTITQS